MYKQNPESRKIIKICWNPVSEGLESGIHRPRIRNHHEDEVVGIWNPEGWNPVKLQWILLHGATYL